MKRTPQGQVYFVHLPSGTRTWHDPRIPKDVIKFLSASRNTESNSDEYLGPMPAGMIFQAIIYLIIVSDNLPRPNIFRSLSDRMKAFGNSIKLLDELSNLHFLSGWECRSTGSGRSYFVDHNTRTTQFSDPRLTNQVVQRLLGVVRYCLELV